MLADALRAAGFAFVEGADMRPRLGALPDWDAFAASWAHLEVDTYMADGGRYRRRRHARYAASAAGIVRLPHGPHHQTVDYNPLHGGVDRWFAPITGEPASLHAILGWAHALFGGLAPHVARWFVECHQFRIEARAGVAGQPTPEGPHRDGVDYVLVLLVSRTNIASGTTVIYTPAGEPLGSFTLATPFDAALVHDPRVYHGVTPVEPIDPAKPAHRDVLVATFRDDTVGR
jgi:hypothetical protein